MQVLFITYSHIQNTYFPILNSRSNTSASREPPYHPRAAYIRVLPRQSSFVFTQRNLPLISFRILSPRSYVLFLDVSISESEG